MPRSGESDGIPNGGGGKRARSFRVSGTLLRSLRIARGWTQNDAAARAGISDRLLRKSESGGPIELQSITLLAELYSAPDAPLTPKHLLALPLDAPSGTSDAARLEAMVRRWYHELWNHGRLGIIEELAAPNGVLHAQGDELRGHAAIRQRLEAVRAAFSDFDFMIDQLAVQGDMAVVRWRVYLTHRGSWLGEPASGRRFVIHGSSWIRAEGNLIAEAWDYWDQQQVIDDSRP